MTEAEAAFESECTSSSFYALGQSARIIYFHEHVQCVPQLELELAGDEGKGAMGKRRRMLVGRVAI